MARLLAGELLRVPRPAQDSAALTKNGLHESDAVARAVHAHRQAVGDRKPGLEVVVAFIAGLVADRAAADARERHHAAAFRRRSGRAAKALDDVVHGVS